VGFRQADSPNDLPAGRTIHVLSTYQVWTVQADLKATLYMHGSVGVMVMMMMMMIIEIIII
jgi:hypothetical protein